jgi:hypothetical protein
MDTQGPNSLSGFAKNPFLSQALSRHDLAGEFLQMRGFDITPALAHMGQGEPG